MEIVWRNCSKELCENWGREADRQAGNQQQADTGWAGIGRHLPAGRRHKQTGSQVLAGRHRQTGRQRQAGRQATAGKHAGNSRQAPTGRQASVVAHHTHYFLMNGSVVAAQCLALSRRVKLISSLSSSLPIVA